MKLKILPSTLAVVVPLAIAVVLNAAVRPWLAGLLGGQMVRRGNAVRGSDRWWTFDAAAQADHPIATAFLNVSDGAIAMAAFALIAVALIGLWVFRRLRF